MQNLVNFGWLSVLIAHLAPHSLKKSGTGRLSQLKEEMPFTARLAQYHPNMNS